MTKNAIVFDAWMLNGALLDSLEYYLFARSIGKDITLVLLENPSFNVKQAISDIVPDRYLVPEQWVQDIQYWNSKTQLLTTKFKNILVFDFTTLEHVPIMRGEKIHIFYDHEPEKAKLYNILGAHDHVTIYNEMPFGVGKPYTMKFAFSLYRKIGYCTGEFVDTKEGRMLKCHQKRLFDSFHTYRYIHDGTFDRRPRMLLEAYFYQKEVYYFNPQKVEDGSWYRWHDLKTNGIKHRWLTRNDEVMRQL
jgi:hypothetical protein